MEKKALISAFKDSPDRGRGLARDMRVRWAFEEVGQTYDVMLVTFKEMKEPDYLKLQPFGQIPAYQEDGLVIFETGSIIFHVAEKFPGLLPIEAHARARAITWIFSALSTMEQPIVAREAAVLMEKEKSWYNDRMPILDKAVENRLKQLSDYLGDKDWLENEFTAGDLMMVSVLKRLGTSGILAKYPNLKAYLERGEARPAYKRAFEAQLAVFQASQKS